MVDLTGGGSRGLLEHGFNNYVFVVAGVLVVSVVGKLVNHYLNLQ